MARKNYSVQASDAGTSVRPTWLDLHHEDAIQPELPIVDAHHHLWDREGSIYLADEFYADAQSGHSIKSSVYIEARAMYRDYGPEEFRSIGEVEFARGMAAIGASGLYGPGRIAAGIVGMADLRRPNAEDILLRLAAAGGERFRGVRHVAAYDADERVSRRYASLPCGLLGNEDFQRGFASLQRLGMSFDAFILHPQLRELTALATRFPDAAIVLDHLGTPLGLGIYAGRRDEVFRDWRDGMRELSRCPNVFVKLSGLGMVLFGFGFHERPQPPSSEELRDAWSRYILTTIELFGVERCMFASNFPPDKGSCSYTVLWNAFKLIVSDFTAEERARLFCGSAETFYRL